MQLVVTNKQNAPLPRLRRKSLVGQAVLVLLGIQLLFFASFVAVDLPTATGHNLLHFGQHQYNLLLNKVPPQWLSRASRYLPNIPDVASPIRMSLYTPQAPTAIFLGYAMGWPVATIAAALYILLGLVGPLVGINAFSAGGGPGYYTQPGFGYLLGMLVATVVVAKLTSEERTSLKQIAALVGGLASIHLVGLVYLLGSDLIFSLFEGARPVWLPWVFEQARNFSWYPLPYDALFGLALIGLGFPIRYLVEMLTAPDMALKSKNDRMVQQRLEELMQ